jgi:hypothetical protein
MILLQIKNAIWPVAFILENVDLENKAEDIMNVVMDKLNDRLDAMMQSQNILRC